MILTSSTMYLHTVKVLALESIGPDVDEVVKFLRCFLCVEKLYIEIRLGPVVDNVIQYNNPMECLDLHLTEITLNSYRGTLPEIIFAGFFFVIASVLKIMRFYLHLLRKKELFADEHRRLGHNGKVFIEAQFHFVTSLDKLFGSPYVKPIHDMSVMDPFAEILKFLN
ncbi:hypothetical protein ZWY2020_025587 [Hordeum vulgare]|nr:hypothetical protein ZWY2020_025587 [Hordeum vulgare]